MDALCAAIPVARTLLRVADSASSSSLAVVAGARRATLRVDHGRVCEVSGVDCEPLGDTLLRRGALDFERHHAALSSGFPEQQVGPWLVSVGAASEPAVRAALAEQLRTRIAAVLRMRGAELVLCPARPASVEPGFDVSVDLVCALHDALVAIASELPADVLKARAGQGALRSTRLGSWLESRLHSSLARPRARFEPQQPAPGFANLLTKQPTLTMWPERAALRAIGALVEANAEVEGYSLLLRKRRELRNRVSSRRLLDLPDDAAPGQARAAFRGLARKLHPDRFHAGEPALLALSTEIMRALSHAEAQLSAEDARMVRAASG